MKTFIDNLIGLQLLKSGDRVLVRRFIAPNEASSWPHGWGTVISFRADDYHRHLITIDYDDPHAHTNPWETLPERIIDWKPAEGRTYDDTASTEVR